MIYNLSLNNNTGNGSTGGGSSSDPTPSGNVYWVEYVHEYYTDGKLDGTYTTYATKDTPPDKGSQPYTFYNYACVGGYNHCSHQTYNGKTYTGPTYSRGNYTGTATSSTKGMIGTITLMYNRYTYNYTMTYHGNGGKINGQDNYTDTVNTSATSYDFYSVEPGSREGYVFNGWYKDAALQTPVNWPYQLTSSKTLGEVWAKWTPKNYNLTVKYVDKDGNNIIAPITDQRAYDTTYTTEKKTFDNYEFVSDSGNTSGTIKGDTTVTYKYKQAPPQPTKLTYNVSWYNKATNEKIKATETHDSYNRNANLRSCIHKRLSRVWKWEITTIDSAEETEIS